MELKKNPKLDYRKKSVLFFNIGLVLSLLIVISAFEWKFVESVSVVDIGDNFIDDEIINIPITEHKPPPKPQLKAAIQQQRWLRTVKQAGAHASTGICHLCRCGVRPDEGDVRIWDIGVDPNHISVRGLCSEARALRSRSPH